MRVFRGCLIALVLAALFVACHKAPTPTAPGPANQQPFLTRLELAGPESIPPGETAQFTATALYSDGSSGDVTALSAWRTARSSVLFISANGVATGFDRGESLVQAVFGGRSSGKNVMVLPAGTFRLSGLVRDAGFPVSGVQVAVSPGSAPGLVATTGDNPERAAGSYSLYGVSGDTEIRVTKPGYNEQRKRLSVTAHATLDFDLTLSGARDQVDGTWALTVTAADECRAKLPEALMQRNYTVLLHQEGPRLTAKLEGATFYSSGNRTFNTFGGVLEPQQLTFQLKTAYYYYSYLYDFPDVLEQLTSSTYVSVSGSVAMTGAGARRSGRLDGAIVTFGAPPLFPPIAWCRSNGHRVELSR